MARFLTTKGALAQIEEVFSTAQRELHLVTPYVQLTDAHARRLLDADARGVQISLVCRYDDLKGDERAFFDGLGNARVLDDPDLHAKCFINEHGLVLTSLNLYGASEKNNEMGVWLDVEGDAEAYRAALLEARSIRDYAVEVKAGRKGGRSGHTSGNGNLNGRPSLPARSIPAREQHQQAKKGTGKGSCIRCSALIAYDPSKPYCRDCYGVWKEWGNPFYEERCCHSCGESNGRYTMEKPECYACYMENASTAH